MEAILPGRRFLNATASWAPVTPTAGSAR